MNNEETKQVNTNQSVATPGPQTPPPVSPTLAQPANTPVEEGVNLIPAMTKEEKIHVKKKNTLNIGSILSIIALATIAIGIVGFNILSKAQLNTKKAALTRIERTVNSKMDKIISNNAILARVKLYEQVKKNSFSHKKIIVFLNEMAARVEGVSYKSISISEALEFEISGSSPNLEQLSRLWYLLGVDDNVNTINLGSVSKGDDDASFTFEGQFNLENFKNE